MAGIDKALIVIVVAIIAIALGATLFMGAAQDAGPTVATPPTVSTETSEPETPTSFGADLAAKVREEAGMSKKDTVKPMMSGWDRLTSDVDPGMGHESHQLAIILAPSSNVYSGTLMYDASEPIQLVALHGPLAEGEDKGQAIWTPDGETKFALTFVNPNSANGEWQFAGNALAVHTMNTEPFIVDYKVDFEETPMSDTVVTGTIDTVTDPGVRHESHQLAIILAPSSNVYSGILSYTASEDIQLVTLRGPIGADEKPAKTWTSDGETIFELTFVNPKNAMGSWEFSGNALAVHTMHTNQATISYSVSATVTPGQTMEVEETMMEETAAQAEADAAAQAEADAAAQAEADAAAQAEADAAAQAEADAAPQTHTVDAPAGTSVPGCEETNSCFTPADITINAGDTVEWNNIDTAAHTVTSGSPADGPSGVFDSSLLMADATFAFTFEDAGEYDYFCMVHPWMVGSVSVN
jgi:plastocyanin